MFLRAQQMSAPVDQTPIVIGLVVSTIAVQILLSRFLTVLLQFSGGVKVFFWFVAIAVGWTALGRSLQRRFRAAPAIDTFLRVSVPAVWMLPITYLQVSSATALDAASFSWIDLSLIIYVAVFFGSDIFYNIVSKDS
jgi:hypothetical protein